MFEADFAEVGAAGHVVQRRAQLVEGEDLVDHRLHAVLADGPDHGFHAVARAHGDAFETDAPGDHGAQPELGPVAR